jgi:ribosomal protein S1
VKVQGEIDGLIKKQDLSEDKDEPYDDALKRFHAGQAVKALVIELSVERQKLGLSIRDLVRRQQREEISRFMQDDSARATPSATCSRGRTTTIRTIRRLSRSDGARSARRKL